MAKFFQPAKTQGIYEAGPNRLTVNQGDRVMIGFRGFSAKELDETTVDASENVIAARYSINSTSIELEIDTSKPIGFELTATQEVSMSAIPKNMTKPLEVYVRATSAASRNPVGQERDPAGCWAACLSYFLTVAPGRQERRFIDIIGDFNGLWDSSGFIKVVALQQQLAKQATRYRMATERIVPNRLTDFIGRWPLLIGFRHPGGFGHMNVLTGYDEANDLVRAMDPWSPAPPPNCFTRESGQVIFNGTEGDFTFKGVITYRDLKYYQSAMGSGMIFVGYPEEYKKRMP